MDPQAQGPDNFPVEGGSPVVALKGLIRPVRGTSGPYKARRGLLTPFGALEALKGL